jgi:hypothetical protein
MKLISFLSVQVLNVLCNSVDPSSTVLFLAEVNGWVECIELRDPRCGENKLLGDCQETTLCLCDQQCWIGELLEIELVNGHVGVVDWHFTRSWGWRGCVINSVRLRSSSWIRSLCPCY